jgi:mannobiose 2-epimerase
VDTDGGVYSEGEGGVITKPEKEWWEQAESAVGFLGAYQISGDPGYLSDCLRSWRFIQGKLVDRVHGDWYDTLARDGTPILEIHGRGGMTFPASKLSIWKCPYHNSRACMELIDRARELAGAPP